MIKSKARLQGAMTVLLISMSFAAHAQRVPGEDPVSLSGPVQHLSLPGGALAKSGQIDGNLDMPAWMKARVARYEAKVFSATANDGTILTDNDVVNTSRAQGLSRTCVQEIGSNTQTNPGSGNGPGAQQQIVVLRGDLINVCR